MIKVMGERPFSQKHPHDYVDYQDQSPFEGRSCGNCSMFIADQPYRCTIVKGPIFKGGWCKRWDREK